MSDPAKRCPACKTINPLNAATCQCGHQFRTQFAPPKAPEPTRMVMVPPSHSASPPPAVQVQPPPQFHPPAPPKKQTKTWQVVLIAILAICFLRVIAETAAGDTKPRQQPPPAPVAHTPRMVLALKGSGSKRSQPFTLSYGSAQLHYAVRGDQAVLCSIYVVEEGTSLDRQGGFPEVTVDQPGSDSTRIVKGPGTYYLDVNSANCDWAIEVDE